MLFKLVVYMYKLIVYIVYKCFDVGVILKNKVNDKIKQGVRGKWIREVKILFLRIKFGNVTGLQVFSNSLYTSYVRLSKELR